MSLVVNHNLMAMNAARNLQTVFSRLSQSTQRLSSGLRINSAADDAAGLAIREIMRADIAILNQGIRNANDAISLIQTAEGALSVIDEKLIRMKELAEQASTGTYTTAQRQIMDSEFTAMLEEVNRIAAATDFNGIHLLDGSLSALHQGSGLKVHFGTGNASEEDYYYINIDASDASGLGIYDPEPEYYEAGSQFRVNTDTSQNQTSASVTALADGGFIVAWGSDDTGNGDVYAQRYNSTGAVVGSQFLISPTSNRFQGNVSITGLTDGGFVATYDMDSAGLGAFTEVYGMMFDANGNAVGTEFVVNDNPLLFQGSSDVAGLSNGGFVVTWDSLTGDHDIYGQLYNGAGSAVGLNFAVASAVGDQSAPRAAGLEDGEGFVIVWQAADGEGDGIYGQRYLEDGSTSGAAFQINTTYLGDQTSASITSLEDGGYAVTWVTDQGGSKSVWGRVYDANGAAVGRDFEVTDVREGYSPEITSLSGGGFLVTWTDDDGIQGRTYDSRGSPVTDAFQIGDTTGDQGAPCAVGLADDSFVAIWTSDHETGTDDIYGQRFAFEGASYIGSQRRAQAALETLDEAILSKDKIRASLGALQNRLENSITQLTIQAEMLQGAESRISDIDVATEMTILTKNNILSQAATSMLAQANSIGELALQLLS